MQSPINITPVSEETSQHLRQRFAIFKQSIDEAFADPRMKTMIMQSLSQGLATSLTAVHLIGNDMLMSSFDVAAKDASNIVSTLQSVVMSASVGFATSAGTRVASAIEKNNHEQVASMIKIAWLNSFILGACFTGIFLSTRILMPHLLAQDQLGQETAAEVWNFFKYASWSPIAYIMIHMDGLIVLKVEKEAKTQLIAQSLYRLPSLALGYILAHPMGMGVAGIGLGSTIPALVVCVGMKFKFRNEIYAQYNLMNLCHIPSFCTHFNSFFADGWKQALQRLTEWINLFCITMVIGRMHKDALLAEEPSINAMILFNLFTQGITQAGILEVSSIHSQMEVIKNDLTQRAQYLNLRKSIHNVFIVDNALGLCSNSIGLVVLLLFNRYLSDVTIDQSVPLNIRSSMRYLTELFLVLNAISLIPDSIRHISGGILRGWNDPLIPTLISLFWMTCVGVSAGTAVTYSGKMECATSLFMFRLLTIALSSKLTYDRFYDKYRVSESLTLKPVMSNFTGKMFPQSRDIESRINDATETTSLMLMTHPQYK